jgi:hypothetical protein
LYRGVYNVTWLDSPLPSFSLILPPTLLKTVSTVCCIFIQNAERKNKKCKIRIIYPAWMDSYMGGRDKRIIVGSQPSQKGSKILPERTSQVW